VNNHSIPSMQAERQITDLSVKHSFTLYPSLSPYSGTELRMEKQINPAWLGWVTYGSSRLILVGLGTYGSSRLVLVGLGNLQFLQVNRNLTPDQLLFFSHTFLGKLAYVPQYVLETRT
jgi:hypothetical protein